MFQNKYRELREKAELVNALGEIYDAVKKEMNWDVMEFHEADENHDEVWFTEPKEQNMTDYAKSKYKAYTLVLGSIEKLAK